MADNELIEKLLIHTPHEINTGTSQLQNIIITITATKEDTFNPGKFEVKESIFNVNPEKKIEDLINDFKRQHKYPNDKYYLIYNNRLFENGTLAQAGITNRKKLTFFAPANEKKLAENEGFKLKFWSYPALCLAFSFLFAGLVCRFDYRLRGAYVLVGSLIGVPAMVCFLIGLTEAFSKATNTSFTGSEWFGSCYYGENSCCSCCCCCCKPHDSL
ncbi:hypothetical protein TVAG_335030 [Trichomonas vaginalis G3]|uniref:Ubiquitin-like domain-containing protein n=1 Tax=Trichomonas vaginalis (strain ATCC PRA-98 / G3) TaxID=412133 RepID=A2FK90_TRIV3|nr:ubiquitin-like family [Trichomonas vaginalis G3]EAX94667.1 hypothetical protein TVAG_335030 [Trichomonas vaginalis G3]KAI5510200.1 ubiquitin-like family [Trichomonas vaginalis G3]|eukprot:XP_001307597.1 hypothetical protein [Trichomonas vaginalis G3]